MTRCPEHPDSTFEFNLHKHFNDSEIIIKQSRNHRAGMTTDKPASRWLLLVAALLLVPLLAACTGKGIGGTSTGWNALVSDSGTVYVGTKEGEVKAFIDSESGDVRESWVFPAPGSSIELEGVYNTPLVVGDLLYVSAQNGVLYALDKETGTITDKGWRRPEGEPQDLDPLIGGPAYDRINELVVVASEDGRLYGYDADTGESIWSPFSAGDKIWSTPAIRDAVAYFGSHDKNIYAVSLASGREIWSYPTGGVVAGRPLLVNNMVIAGSFDKKLYALDASDGSLVWEFEANNWFWAGAVTNGQTIFAPNMNGKIYALDLDGNLEWEHDAGSSIVSRPVLLPSGLVVVNKKGKLSLLDVSTGAGRQRELSALKLGDAEVKAPLVAEGESVYVGSQDRSFRRVEVKNGPVVLWCRHTEDGRCKN